MSDPLQERERLGRVGAKTENLCSEKKRKSRLAVALTHRRAAQQSRDAERINAAPEWEACAMLQTLWPKRRDAPGHLTCHASRPPDKRSQSGAKNRSIRTSKRYPKNLSCAKICLSCQGEPTWGTSWMAGGNQRDWNWIQRSMVWATLDPIFHICTTSRLCRKPWPGSLFPLPPSPSLSGAPQVLRAPTLSWIRRSSRNNKITGVNRSRDTLESRF